MPRAIIGRIWCRRHCPSVNWDNDCLTITQSDGSIVSIHPRTQKKERKVTFKKISIKQLRKDIRKKGTELFALTVSPQLAEMYRDAELHDLVQEYGDLFSDELPCDQSYDFQEMRLQNYGNS